jgi:hypothetical protein
VLLCLASERTAQAYSAILNKADHTEVPIVPAPGKVTIDGDLRDWDMSGAILVFMDEKSKETHQLRGAMMYDKDYLYVGGQGNSDWHADALPRHVVGPHTGDRREQRRPDRVPPAPQRMGSDRGGMSAKGLCP